jgi:hypothetical protein
MATQNLLTMVQNILAAMSSDEVNSISDSVESMQVAQIIQNKYYDIVARGDLELDEQFFQLTPADNLATPTLMFLPSGVSRISYLQYYDTNPADNTTQTSQFGAYSHDLNIDVISTVQWTTTSLSTVTIPATVPSSVTFILTSAVPASTGQQITATHGTNYINGTVAGYAGNTLTVKVINWAGSGTFSNWVVASTNSFNLPPGYRYVTILDNSEFLDMVNKFDLTQVNVQPYVFTQGGLNFNAKYMNDRQPSWATVISNFYVLFDSLDTTQDSSLQASKTLLKGQVVPPFKLQDSFIPTLNDQQLPLLLNEAKALAFFELKQMPHALADRELKRQWTATQKNKSIANRPSYFDQLPNYGRFAVGPWLNYRYGTRWTRSGAFPW